MAPGAPAPCHCDGCESCDAALLDKNDRKRRRLGSSGSSPGFYPISPESPSDHSAVSDVDQSECWTLRQFEHGSPERVAGKELARYVADWKGAEKDEFWQRKSGKPVLAVAVCRSKDGDLATYRGRNTEVSLPAGSLCAERAAIARAASEFHHASELVAIAVLDPSDKLNPLWPCEVCQSWLTKLRSQSPEISVLAATSSACESFALRVNGEPRLPPVVQIPPQVETSVFWPEYVILAEDTMEWPWTAKDLVYVDGAWTFLHSSQQNILKVARAKGTHLLVGVHSDETLRREFDGPILENFATRIGRILQHRCVSSVLKDAPWCVTEDLIKSLGIRRVITGSVCKTQDVGTGDADPYKAARELGVLEVVPSWDETTEKSIRESHAAIARS